MVRESNDAASPGTNLGAVLEVWCSTTSTETRSRRTRAVADMVEREENSSKCTQVKYRKILPETLQIHTAS
jgi:hypothetical protein